MKLNWLARDLMVGPYVTLVCSEKRFDRAMRKCGIKKADRPHWIKTEHAHATVHFLENSKKEAVAIVAIRDHKDRDPVEVVGLLIHEAVHIWQDFAERIGEVAPSKEFEAYAIQSISQRLIAAYDTEKNHEF